MGVRGRGGRGERRQTLYHYYPWFRPLRRRSGPDFALPVDRARKGRVREGARTPPLRDIWTRSEMSLAEASWHGSPALNPLFSPVPVVLRPSFQLPRQCCSEGRMHKPKTQMQYLQKINKTKERKPLHELRLNNAWKCTLEHPGPRDSPAAESGR